MTVDPVAFTVFSFPIYWYGLVYFIGFILGYYFLLHYGSRYFKKQFIEDSFFYMILFSLIGARLFHVFLYEPSYYLQNLLQIIRFDQGGMSIHGGLFFGLMSLWYQSRKHKVNVLKILDLIVIPLSLALSFGRIANFINQELVGKVTDSKIGVIFDRYDDQKRYPVQLFESIAYMVNFQTLLFLHVFSKLKPGILFSLFVIIYNGSRFLLEFFKDTQTVFLFLSLEQILCLLFIIFGVYVLFKVNSQEGFSLYSKVKRQ